MAADVSSEKRQLHELIDQLPPERSGAFLRAWHCLSADPVLLSLLNAPLTMSPTWNSSAGKMRRQRTPSRAEKVFLMRTSCANSSARAQLRAVDRETAMRILIAFTRYAETGEGDVKALEGKFTGTHRLRIGDWRVRFRRAQSSIHILAVENRGAAY